VYYIFSTVDGSIESVRVRRGSGGAKVLNRGGGWEVVQRARRKGATQWAGAEPARVAVPILFDGWITKNSQEDDIATLSRMALPIGVGKEPPKIRVSPGVPLAGLRWIIQGLDWGDNQIWDRDNSGSLSRMRQDATVTLLEWVPPEIIATNTGASPNPGQLSPNRVLYNVKAGDSLATIAIDVYGDRSRWLDIADANGLRDLGSVAPGEVIRLP
jgi:hypothetical protein